MKVYSMKSVYLSLDELREAIVNWLQENGENDLAKHMKANLCNFDWDHEDGNHADPYLVVDMGGYLEENEE